MYRGREKRLCGRGFVRPRRGKQALPHLEFAMFRLISFSSAYIIPFVVRLEMYTLNRNVAKELPFIVPTARTVHIANSTGINSKESAPVPNLVFKFQGRSQPQAHLPASAVSAACNCGGSECIAVICLRRPHWRSACFFDMKRIIYLQRAYLFCLYIYFST
jgi:hypothetical protein